MNENNACLWQNVKLRYCYRGKKHATSDVLRRTKTAWVMSFFGFENLQSITHNTFYRNRAVRCDGSCLGHFNRNEEAENLFLTHLQLWWTVTQPAYIWQDIGQALHATSSKSKEGGPPSIKDIWIHVNLGKYADRFKTSHMKKKKNLDVVRDTHTLKSTHLLAARQLASVIVKK